MTEQYAAQGPPPAYPGGPQGQYPGGPQAPYPGGPQGQPAYPQYAQQQAYTTTTVVQAHPQQVVAVVGAGNCPRCGVGNIVEDFSICGILLAIFCFPIGIICCLLMRDRRCSHCG